MPDHLINDRTNLRQNWWREHFFGQILVFVNLPLEIVIIGNEGEAALRIIFTSKTKGFLKYFYLAWNDSRQFLIN